MGTRTVRDVRLTELGEFLRARRSDLHPADLGLASGGEGHRRVPGLRREEVAGLAAISTDYYARLEQGRLPPSVPVLEDLARIFRLDEDQTAYLFALAGKPQRVPGRDTQEIQAYLQTMLDDLSTTPAFVVGRRTQVLSWNTLGSALLMDFGSIPVERRQFLRVLFTEPSMRMLYADWEEVARLTIAQLRMDAGRYPDDPQLAGLVAELSETDERFREWWGMHDVALRDNGVKILNHPLVGTLQLNWHTLASPSDPDQQIVVWTAEVGTPSHERLLSLAGSLKPVGDGANVGRSD